MNVSLVARGRTLAGSGADRELVAVELSMDGRTLEKQLVVATGRHRPRERQLVGATRRHSLRERLGESIRLLLCQGRR